MPLTLVVLAAGIGSRYGGLKQLDPVGPGGEAILDYSVFDALRAGFSRVVFVIRPDLEAEFRERARPFAERAQVDYAFQDLAALPEGFAVPPTRRKPWGTGHALLSAAPAVATPFAAINADDFYGAESYATLGRFLAAAPSEASDYALVAYRLADTLSDHGSVARAACRTRDGFLEQVEEFRAIEKTKDGAENRGEGGERRFTGEEPVSLNFWGFTPRVFGQLRRRFAAFLAGSAGDDRAEFLIPEAVNDIIRSGEGRVRVLQAPCRWIGMTYREDRPLVVERVREAVRRGEYEDPLWG